MKLQRPAVLSAEVQVGRLPPAGLILPNGYPCVLSGWGRLTSASGTWQGQHGREDTRDGWDREGEMGKCTGRWREGGMGDGEMGRGDGDGWGDGGRG